MRIKLSVVGLLALAGTAGIFFAARFEPHGPARPLLPRTSSPSKANSKQRRSKCGRT